MRRMTRYRGGISRYVAELMLAVVAIAVTGIYFSVASSYVKQDIASVAVLDVKLTYERGLENYILYLEVTLRNTGTKQVKIYNPLAYVILGDRYSSYKEIKLFSYSLGYVVLEPGEIKTITFVGLLPPKDFKVLYPNAEGELDVWLLFIKAWRGGEGGGGGWYPV